jgi:hypothetical protein
MGYRSDVHILFYADTPEDFPAMKLAITENITTPGFLSQMESRRGRVGDILYFNIFDIKWYDSYSEIQEFEKLFNLFDEMDRERGWNYEFVRIGEELDDIEEKHSANPGFYLRVTRSVELDI